MPFAVPSSGNGNARSDGPRGGVSFAARAALAGWIGMAVALIVWPFSLASFSSQVAGGAMLLPGLLDARVRRAVLRSTYWTGWVPLALLAALLMLHLLAGRESGVLPAHFNTGLGLFLLYMVKIPLLYLLAGAALLTLQHAGFAPAAAQRIIWLAVLAPLAVVVAQLLSPDFHTWSVAHLGGFRAAQVLSRQAQGHPFRFLGPNGFLFASHGVAFACTALGLLCFRAGGSRRRWGSVLLTGIEGACLLMAVLSARSALPLVALYLVVRVACAGHWRRRLAVGLAYVLAVGVLVGAAMLSPGGRQLLSWLTEPVRTSLAEGRLASHSVDDTLDTYEDVASPDGVAGRGADRFANNDWLGHGLYFRDNRNYSGFDLMGSDSGFVRVIYAAGYAGLALFLLFWVGMTAHAVGTGAGGAWHGVAAKPPLGDGGLRVVENARRRVGDGHERPVRWFLWVFVAYGLLFFFKSEWLYQNFFAFQFFCLFHYLQGRAPS